MCKQLSLLFDCRSRLPEEVKFHADACLRAIGIYMKVIRSGRLKDSSFETLLLILAGIGDNLLTIANEPGSVGRIIAPKLLQCVYEAWLVSRTHDERLWDIFAQIHRGWLHFPDPIIQWGATVAALTNTILLKQYHPEEKLSGKIMIRLPNDEFSAIEADQDIHYFWVRFLRLVGNPNTCGNPEVFRLWMGAYREVATLFLHPILQGEYGAPDGNAVLNLIGTPLLQAMLLNRPNFHEGTAIAIETVSSIIGTCKTTEFNTKYLAAYYQAAQNFFQSQPDSLVFVEMVNCSQMIVLNNTKGVRVLIPFLIFAIESVLAHEGKFKVNAANVRAACYTIISGICCLATSFGNAKFPRVPQQTEYNRNPPVCSYADLEPHIGNILLKGLVTEQSHENLLTLYNLSVVFLNEFLAPASGKLQQDFDVTSPMSVPGQTSQVFAWSFMMLLITKLIDAELEVELADAALGSLCCIVPVLKHIPNHEKFASFLVYKVCSVITQLMNSLEKIAMQQQGAAMSEVQNQMIADNTRIIVSAYHTVVYFVLSGAWAGDFTQQGAAIFPGTAMMQETLFQTLLAGLGAGGSKYDQRHMLASKDIYDAASWGLSQVLSYLGAFPSKTGYERLSSAITEDQIFAAISSRAGIPPQEMYKFVRYFAVSRYSLLTFIDVPLTTEDGAVMSTVIIRTSSGKSVWQAKLSMTPSTLKDAKAEAEAEAAAMHQLRPNATRPFVSQYSREKCMNKAEVSSIVEYLNTLSNNSPFVNQLVPQIAAADEEYCKRNGYGLTTQRVAAPPALIKTQDVMRSAIPARGAIAFATQFGLCNPVFSDLVAPLAPSDTLFEGLKILDNIPERECISVSLLAAPRGTHSEKELYSVGDLPELNQFCTAMGSSVDLQTFGGYMGQQDRGGKTGKYSVYFADNETELMFHLLPFMDCTPELKKAIASRSKVLIIWAQDSLFNPAVLNDLNAYFFIVVSPVDEGLFRLNVYSNPRQSKPNVSPMIVNSPITNDEIVSRIALPAVLRRMIKRSVRRFDVGFNAENMVAMRGEYINALMSRTAIPDSKSRPQLLLYAPQQQSLGAPPPAPVWESIGATLAPIPPPQGSIPPPQPQGIKLPQVPTMPPAGIGAPPPALPGSPPPSPIGPPPSGPIGPPPTSGPIAPPPLSPAPPPASSGPIAPPTGVPAPLPHSQSFTQVGQAPAPTRPQRPGQPALTRSGSAAGGGMSSGGLHGGGMSAGMPPQTALLGRQPLHRGSGMYPQRSMTISLSQMPGGLQQGQQHPQPQPQGRTAQGGAHQLPQAPRGTGSPFPMAPMPQQPQLQPHGQYAGPNRQSVQMMQPTNGARSLPQGSGGLPPAAGRGGNGPMGYGQRPGPQGGRGRGSPGLPGGSQTIRPQTRQHRMISIAYSSHTLSPSHAHSTQPAGISDTRLPRS